MLQDGAQTALELIEIILGVVDPDLDLLVHRLAGEIAAGGDGDRAGDAMRRLADTGRRDKQTDVTPQQGTPKDPTAPRQQGKVKVVEEARLQRLVFG